MKTKFLAGASVGAILLAGGAQAATPATQATDNAPPRTSVGWSWAGPYIGANIGAVFHQGSVADAPSTSVPFLTSFNANPVHIGGSGVVGGLEAGYNWQMANLVLGVEADISGSSLDHTKSWYPNPGATANTTLNWLGTVRGRVGWALGRTLVYGTGGIAFAHLKDELNPFVTTSTDVTGWTAGAGVEYALPDHWTVKAEYLHVGFPDRTVTNEPSGYAFRFRDSLDIARVGVNYSF